jgi:hypothetical protein
MDDTIRRVAKVLNGRGLEISGPDARFEVQDGHGSRLKVSVEGARQRMMGVLLDANGVARTTFDVAPIASVREDPKAPGRVTLVVGSLEVQIDTLPALALEIVSPLSR